MPRPHAAANDFGIRYMTDSTASSDVLKVTLLGTGIPNPQINAFGTSTLIEAGDQKVLIDCGRGAAIRLSQIGLGVGCVDTIFHFALSFRSFFWPVRYGDDRIDTAKIRGPDRALACSWPIRDCRYC
jgi:hypothetical protein